MNKSDIVNVLKKLDKTHNKPEGYSASEILTELKLPLTKNNKKRCRAKSRSLISKQKYPEFKTGGYEDIVYCPIGKWSGKYKLSNNP